MSVYDVKTMTALLQGNTYPGRGIVIGKSMNGRYACVCYFIMGRSTNSRNRIFAMKDGALYTEPFDPSLVSDPSLIIYAAIRRYENKLIVTNGDQTDTVYEGLKNGLSFAESLRSRTFEPDAPNLTPRISGLLTFSDADFSYDMSILKSADPEGKGCHRFTYEFASVNGVGHFIHTYEKDGNPLPTFHAEPERIFIPDSIDDMTNSLWQALDADNRISLYVSYTDLATGEVTDRLINRHTK